MLDAYAEYLNKSTLKRVHKTSPNSSLTLLNNRGASTTDLIRESAQVLINDKKVGSRAPRKIVELSLKIIKH